MRILVLGGTQFIGPHVVRYLTEAGHDVTVFHRGQTEADLGDVRHVHGDFAEFEQAVPGLEAEVVVDMVPWIAKSGRQGVAHFEGVARRGVVVTSADVYRAFARLWRSEPGPADPVPLTEDSPLRQMRAPDRTGEIDFDNIETEAWARDAKLPVTVMRLPATHGPGDLQHRLFEYVKRMDDRRPAMLLDEAFAGWRWARGYVEDVGVAIALAAGEEKAAGRVYNVAQPKAYTEAEWVRRVADVHGWSGEIVAAPAHVLPEDLRGGLDAAQEFVVDSSRIRDELGYAERISDDEGIRRTIEWERANPPPQTFDYEAEDRALAAVTT